MVFALCLRMETKHLPRHSAQGMALIEVALVLVCTSLLFVSVAKGSELIHNAQSKRVAREIAEHRLAFLAYLNRYDAMPGDDPRASLRWSGAKNGNGDQQISGIYSDAPPTSASALYVSAGTGENLNYWWHLRAAGLLQDGALNLASTADSAVGCTVTVQQSANGMRGPGAVVELGTHPVWVSRVRLRLRWPIATDLCRRTEAPGSHAHRRAGVHRGSRTRITRCLLTERLAAHGRPRVMRCPTTRRPRQTVS